MYPEDTPQCWHHHMGFWCVMPEWFFPALHAWQRGEAFQKQGDLLPIEAREPRAYEFAQEGTAIFPLMGPLTKGGSAKFAGTSTVRTRQALRMAVRDESVQNGVLHIDSPGGHVAGIEALATDIALFARHKPLIAQIDDLGASAAYWAASQATAIHASATSEIGSIGTVIGIEDSSARMDRLGIKVHVISTGPYKGGGAEGVPVSERFLAYMQERVDALNNHFLAAIQSSRRMSAEHLAMVSDGRVHIAAQAQALGLIDRVQSLDETVAQLRTAPGAPLGSRGRATRADMLLAEADARLLQRGGIHPCQP